jgi:pleiotropic regulator 1
MFLG